MDLNSINQINTGCVIYEIYDNQEYIMSKVNSKKAHQQQLQIYQTTLTQAYKIDSDQNQNKMSLLQQQRDPSSLISPPPRPDQDRQSHQIKALLFKTATLQRKQYCTNICQILTPIICLVFTMLIRQMAIENLTTNQDSVYNKLPPIGFRFNDFEYMNELNGTVFNFTCNRWFLYDWESGVDSQFIGKRDGGINSTGMLSHILKTNKGNCLVNDSFAYPYNGSTKQTIPYLTKPKLSIDSQIYSRYMYFNNMSVYNIRTTTAADKMPDGAVYFRQASSKGVNVDMKVNDQRSLQLHSNNGMTKLQIKDPTVIKSKFMSYYTITQGILNTIDMITGAFIRQVTNNQVVAGYLYMPAVGNSSGFIQMLINIVSTIIFPLSLSLLLPVFLYNIVLEKQTKIIQMMRMNGLGITTYWTVNFLFCFLFSVITFVVFYAFGVWAMGNPFCLNTSPLLMWVILLGWAVCQIGMAMLFQVFISNSRAANIIGYLLTIWTNLIGATLSVALYQYPVEMPFAVSLWPTIAFNRLFYLMFINCSSDRCFSSFSNLPDEVTRCIWIIYVAGFSFILLGMYLFEIVPQEFGVRKGVMFPFTEVWGYFRKNNANVLILQNLQENLEDESSERDELARKEKNKVQQTKFMDHAMICKGLTKVYDNGKRATTDFNLIIEDNQAFGLLGPNGAGKTTLISMITGIFGPTSGSAHIAGYSIKDQIDKVHMHMGVCPQFDILWDELTVQEHLYFYARLRGVSAKMEDTKVKQTLNEIALQDFAKFKVRQLSGGMKRRLSVAISLVGNPRIVFLDQPTTGLDPENRRNLWQLLSRCKAKRSLFLTTHLMQEAETLCDRIGIITSSHLRTVGSKAELRKMYGKGYTLTVSVESGKMNMIQEAPQQMAQKMEEQREQNELSSSYSATSTVYRRSEQSAEAADANEMINDSVLDVESKIHMTSLMQQDATAKRLKYIEQKIYGMFDHSQINLVKNINGTLKFQISPNTKISILIENLQKLKLQFNSKYPTSSIETKPSIMDFDWSINNSSLEDVFFNAIQRFEGKGSEQIQQQ